MFTLGIVVHETYRSENGDWLTPAEVRFEGDGPTRKAFSTSTGRPVEIGAIEKMSKSRRNVVDPDDIVANYGADTARLFIVSDSPPDRDIIWTDAGVAGAGRQIQRISRLIDEWSTRKCSRIVKPALNPGSAHAAPPQDPEQCCQNIEAPLQRMAVAQIYELACHFAALEQIGRGPGLGHPRGRRAARADDRPDAAAFGRGVLGAARIQHYAGRSALAGGRSRLAR
jgi:leucyl-tRNA synthetase